MGTHNRDWYNPPVSWKSVDPNSEFLPEIPWKMTTTGRDTTCPEYCYFCGSALPNGKGEREIVGACAKCIKSGEAQKSEGEIASEHHESVCPTCNGEGGGHLPSGNWSTCGTCSGRGFVLDGATPPAAEGGESQGCPAKCCPKCGAAVIETYHDGCQRFSCQSVGSRISVVQHETCQLRELKQANTKLQAFKEWVHNWLDRNGVPHDPNAEHNTKTGCRIGGRLEWLKAERDKLAADLAVVTADNAVLLKAVKDTAFYTTDATVTYCRHCSVYRDGSGLREHEKRDHSSSCLMLQSHPGTTLIAKIEGLEDKIKTLDASTEPCVIDEARWLDERNAGGESIARMILEGASGDGMSDGPIPQALKLVEGLRRLADAKSIRIEKLERLAVVVKKRRDGSEEFQSLLLLADGADRRGRLNEYSDRRDAELDEMDDLLDELEPIPSPAVSVEAGEAKKAGANE